MRNGTIQFIDNVIRIYKAKGELKQILDTARNARVHMNGPDCTNDDREHQDLFITKLEIALNH